MMKKLLILITLLISSTLFAITVNIDKTEYLVGDDIKVTLSDGMPNNESSWVGIYKKSELSSWDNAYSWSYGNNSGNGIYTLSLKDTPAGEYEARVFINDDISTLIASKGFTVKEKSYNTTITTQAVQNSNTPISVTVTNMPGNEGDWIGIFQKGKPSIWENVLTWKWDGNVKDGTYTLDGLPAGEYEARVFLNNSYTVLASVVFKVEDVVLNTKVTIDKPEYLAGESIKVTLSGMPGNPNDWVGIYKRSEVTTWDNAYSWHYGNGIKDGIYDLSGVPAGEYEARVFFNDTLKVMASVSFIVKEKPLVTTISTDKTIYENGEPIKVIFKNMLGTQKDWIGIFPVGASNKFENAYDWQWTYGDTNWEVTFHGLPAGEYEARAFFNNTFDLKATYRFKVTKVKLPDTVLEDAENGLNPNWLQILGKYPPKRATPGFKSSGTLVLNPEWKKVNGEWENGAEYQLSTNFSIHNILQMDIGGLPEYKLNGTKKGYMPHFSIGVHVKTKEGKRTMIWDSYFNHKNLPAHIMDYGNGQIWLNYPSPVEHVRGWYKPTDYWAHFKVNIESELKRLEPDNKLIYIESLYLTGGFLDNIKLSTE